MEEHHNRYLNREKCRIACWITPEFSAPVYSKLQTHIDEGYVLLIGDSFFLITVLMLLQKQLCHHSSMVSIPIINMNKMKSHKQDLNTYNHVYLSDLFHFFFL